MTNELPPATAVRLETFLESRLAATVQKYRTALLDILGYLRRPIGTVTINDLLRYENDLTRNYHDVAGAPTSTVRHRMRVAKSFFRFAYERRWIPSDPAVKLSLPKVRDRKDERILDEAQVLRMIAIAAGRERTLLRVLYGAGTRVSEACALRVRDVLLDDKGRGALLVNAMRGNLRIVPVKASLYADLIRLAGGRDRAAFLFAGKVTGQPLTRDGARRIVRRCAAAAGLALVPSPHWLRHCHGAHAELNGAPLSSIQRTLGHSSRSTTLGYCAAPAGASSAFALRD